MCNFFLLANLANLETSISFSYFFAFCLFVFSFLICFVLLFFHFFFHYAGNKAVCEEPESGALLELATPGAGRYSFQSIILLKAVIIFH